METQNKLCYKESRDVAEAVDKLIGHIGATAVYCSAIPAQSRWVRIMIEGKDQRAIENDAHISGGDHRKKHFKIKKSRQAFLFFNAHQFHSDHGISEVR